MTAGERYETDGAISDRDIVVSIGGQHIGGKLGCVLFGGRPSREAIGGTGVVARGRAAIAEFSDDVVFVFHGREG